MISSSLFVYKIIACQSNVVPWACYHIEKSKTLLINNILSKNQSFFAYIRTNTSNKLGYSKEKDLSIDLKE